MEKDKSAIDTASHARSRVWEYVWARRKGPHRSVRNEIRARMSISASSDLFTHVEIVRTIEQDRAAEPRKGRTQPSRWPPAISLALSPKNVLANSFLWFGGLAFHLCVVSVRRHLTPTNRELVEHHPDNVYTLEPVLHETIHALSGRPGPHHKE